MSDTNKTKKMNDPHVLQQVVTSDYRRKKDWLRRYRDNRSELRRLEERLYSIDARLGTSSPTINDAPAFVSSLTTGDLIVQKNEIEQRASAVVATGKELRFEICKKIAELPNVYHRRVLESYYIDCKSINCIAREMDRSPRRITNYQADAIDALKV